MSDDDPRAKWPTLPANPKGWQRQMVVHLNFGRAGGAATFKVLDPDGLVMPFGYQYDTRKGGLTGFIAPKIEGVLTWAQLRKAWKLGEV